MKISLIISSFAMCALVGCGGGGGSGNNDDSGSTPTVGAITLSSVQVDGSLNESATVTWTTDNGTTTNADNDSTVDNSFSTGAMTFTDPGSAGGSQTVALELTATDGVGNAQKASVDIVINP